MHLDFIVVKKAFSFVPTNIIVTNSGGSSNVFSKQFCASFVIKSAWSIIYTFFSEIIGFSWIFFCSSLICSILILFPSGSIQKKSGLLLLLNSMHDLQWLQALSSLKHKIPLANSVAIIFFPIPDTPIIK